MKPPGTERFKLKYDLPLSNFAFKLNLRRYTQEARRAYLAQCAAVQAAVDAAAATRKAALVARLNPEMLGQRRARRSNMFEATAAEEAAEARGVIDNKQP